VLYPATVYLNGQFISNDKASISPDDRGFYFADGVYEVIKFYKNHPFCFNEHIDRLRNSLNETRIGYKDTDKLPAICDALIEANQFKDKYAAVYIQITRGAAVRTHRFPNEEVRPTVYARSFHISSCIAEMSHGVMVMTREDIRWLRCNIKSIALLPNTLLFEEVAEKGAFECMLIRSGVVTEATHSNVLAVKEGAVHTHPNSNLILPGITRAVVLRICQKLSIPVVEQPIKAREIRRYDEWFLTGTGSEVIPVVQVDGTVVGDGKPGPVTRKIQKEFLRMTYEELAGERMELEESGKR
jgi:D-alanine transaminase